MHLRRVSFLLVAAGVLLITAQARGQCSSGISAGQTASGSLASQCASAHRTSSYARYYVFTLTSNADVQIDMASSAFDTYLYLLNGNGSGGTVLASNDDSQGTNSRILRSLSAGTYTVEATSFFGGVVGNFSVSLAASGAPAPGNCQSNASLNTSIPGTLASQCPSAHRSSRYARYYVFTLTSASDVQIDMASSAFDTYLFLLNGSGSEGTVLASNDDSQGTNSRITRSLSAGTYTVEATSYYTGVTGSFSVFVAASGTPASNCQSNASLNTSIPGTLGVQCSSAHRTSRYARYFVFTLTSNAAVQIDMASSAFDTYLFLLSGSGSGGTVLTSNDDSQGTNSRIIRSLSAGTYTVEATSYAVGATGAFSVSVSASGTTGGDCQSTASLNTSIPGMLASQCASVHRSSRYARYYVFTLTSSAEVQIDMTSSAFDTYLFLLNGSGSGGTVLTSNDDSQGTNARITRSLSAGTYTVEATSYYTGAIGTFSLSVVTSGTPSGNCQSNASLNTNIAGTLASQCASVHRPSSYAKYFVFTLASSADVKIKMASSNFDTFLYLLNGSGSGGAVLASNDDSQGTNSQITRSLTAGTYTVEATSYRSSVTASFSLELGYATVTVFVLHGIGQTSSDIQTLATNLRNEDELPNTRFTVDAGFTYTCASENGCPSSCTLENGGRDLATYIGQHSDPGSDVVLIGYSMGGLLAREAMVNNFGDVFSTRHVRVLATLGTPNVGYAYCDGFLLDDWFKCDQLAQDMASQLRLTPIVQSPALTSLNDRWNVSSTFVGQADYWFTAAGNFCNAALRSPHCDWSEVADGQPNGCPDSSPANDGIVCVDSAFHMFGTNHRPQERWTPPAGSPDYAHTAPIIAYPCSSTNFVLLHSPPVGSSLFQRIVQVLNEH